MSRDLQQQPASPWAGPHDWQRALAALLGSWRAALGAGGREFAVEHPWSLPDLAGHIRSTSFLPAAVLGGQSAAFDAGLAAALAPFGDRGIFTETVSFACDLARKPASLTDG